MESSCAVKENRVKNDCYQVNCIGKPTHSANTNIVSAHNKGRAQRLAGSGDRKTSTYRFFDCENYSRKWLSSLGMTAIEADTGTCSKNSVADSTKARHSRNKRPAACAAGLFSGGGLIFARAFALSLFHVCFLLNKLNQSVDQPTPAADHVQPALMLMLL